MAADSAAAGPKTVVIHGTATPGGGFPVYGAAFSETINEIDPTLSVQTRNTKARRNVTVTMAPSDTDKSLVKWPTKQSRVLAASPLI